MSVHFARDVSTLPTHGYGVRSLTWWGVIAFMAIEGAGFAMAIASYFFLFTQQPQWPPGATAPPGLVPGLIFTALLLASELPNRVLKRHAEEEKIGPVRLLLLVMTLWGALLLVIRAFEFGQLNVSWTDSPYGSIIWALLVLHTTHVLTDWVDTVVLTALMFTRHGPTGRRFVDVSENALYWRFVWLTWLPIWALIYWVPRWT
jgi:heme/copper-type cytochrome/quinol oxidase subunit 3